MSDTERTGGELFVETLAESGVTHVFGNPGTTELPVVHALADSDIEYVLGLHEDIAVGMASGYASTRRHHADGEGGDGVYGGEDRDVLPPGVANLHFAPGLAHGLGDLYAAAVAGAPVLVTAGTHSRDFRHEEPILSGDLVGMADQFTRRADEVRDVDALPAMLRWTVRTTFTLSTPPWRSPRLPAPASRRPVAATIFWLLGVAGVWAIRPATATTAPPATWRERSPTTSAQSAGRH